VEADASLSTIVIFQSGQWTGDPRLGAMVASIDGKRVGLVLPRGSFKADTFPFKRRWWRPSDLPVQERVSIGLTAGHHVIRVRLRWFRSPPVEVDVAAGQVVQLAAGIDRSVGVLRRMGRMFLNPSRSLTLEVV
jgi:hypothetical protein